MSDSPRTCPACGGGQLTFGSFGGHGHRFMPAGTFFSLGYKVNGAVCLDCGSVQHFVAARDLRLLREKSRTYHPPKS